MTNEERAAKLRDLAESEVMNATVRKALWAMADDMSPPKPEPGTVVWWRYREKYGDGKWRFGEVGSDGFLYTFGSTAPRPWEQIEWKPATILQPGQVAVDVPPTHEWGHRTTDVEIVLRYWDVQTKDHEERACLITRAEAEEMQR